MQIFDTIVLLIILIAAFSGWRKGLISQIAAIVSILASSWVATNFSGVLAGKIDSPEPWNNYAAMLILFLGTSVVTWLIFRQINNSVDEMKLGDFDHQIGALFGAVKGFIIASILTLFVIAMPFLQDTRVQIINESKSGGYIAAFLHRVRPYIPERAVAVVGPLFDRLEEIRPSNIPVGSGYQVNTNGQVQGGYQNGNGGFIQPQPPGNYQPQPGYQPPGGFGQPTFQPAPPSNGGSYSGGQLPPTYQPPYNGGAGQAPQTSGTTDWNTTPNGGRF